VRRELDELLSLWPQPPASGGSPAPDHTAAAAATTATSAATTADDALRRELEHALVELAARVDALERSVYLSPPAGAAAPERGACFVEVRAGAGGLESQDWVAMLVRMYTRWAQRQQQPRLRVTLLDETAGAEPDLLKAAVLRVDGPLAHTWLAAESGVHRLVRVWRRQAKRHTSFASVQVLSVADLLGAAGDAQPPRESDVATSSGGGAGDATAVAAAAIAAQVQAMMRDDQLRVETARASGPGGQHVNTTDSAVRVVHLASGISARAQGRSQHANRADALQLLKAKLRDYVTSLAASQRAEQRAALGANAFGSETLVRSYVLHPYQQVRDARCDAETSDATAVLDGEAPLDELLWAAVRWRHRLVH
jgi:peptide chain release factor 2